MKRTTLFGMVVLSVFLLSAATLSVQAAEKPALDEFVFWDTTGDPDSLDPAVAYDTRSGRVIEQVYETLLTYDGSATTLVPNLAKAMPTISSDAMKFTYELREDVDFSDGTHFDAWVMKYSIDRAIILNDPDGPAWMLSQAIAGGWDYLTTDFETADPIEAAQTYLDAGGVVVVDNYTIEFNLDFAYVPFAAALTYTVGSAVSPVAVIDNADADWADADIVPMADMFPDTTGAPDWVTDNALTGIKPNTQHTWMNANAVGTGAYKLTKQESGVGTEFARNDDWWGIGAGKGTPALTKIYYNVVAEAETRILGLKNLETDMAYVPETNMPELYDLDKEEAKFDQINVDVAPSFNVMYFGFNMADEPVDGFKLTTDADSTYAANAATFDKWGADNPESDAKASADNPFTALKFRQAWAQAFDYDGFIDAAVNGWGSRMEGFIPKGMMGHQDNLDLPDFDKAAAKTLFEEVGWKGSIVLTFNEGNDVRKAGGEMLAKSIEALDVGITVTVEGAEWSTYLDIVRSTQAPIYFLGWAPDYADPDNYVNPFLYHTGTLAKRQSYNNTAVNDWIDEAMQETSETQRVSIYKQIEEAAAKDYPVIYGYQGLNYENSLNYVEGLKDGYSLNPMASGVHFADLSKDETKYNSIKPVTSPGFDMIMVLAVLGIGAVVVTRRRK